MFKEAMSFVVMTAAVMGEKVGMQVVQTMMDVANSTNESVEIFPPVMPKGNDCRTNATAVDCEWTTVDVVKVAAFPVIAVTAFGMHFFCCRKKADADEARNEQEPFAGAAA